MKTLINDPNFRRWIEDSLAANENVLATSNQGTVLLYPEAEPALVIKSAMGSPLARRLRLATLRREFQAYERMGPVTGVPRCFGMLADRYLVLEYVEAQAYRGAMFGDREAFFARLLECLQTIHERGVGHGDLKRKSNLLVLPGDRPCVIDFGIAVTRQDGWHPLNHALFGYARRTDLNAWVKHKYHGDYNQVSAADRQYLRYSRLERFLRGRRQAAAAKGRKSIW